MASTGDRAWAVRCGVVGGVLPDQTVLPGHRSLASGSRLLEAREVVFGCWDAGGGMAVETPSGVKHAGDPAARSWVLWIALKCSGAL